MHPNPAWVSIANMSKPTPSTNKVVCTDVVGDLVAREPHLDRDVVFGIRARDVVEDRLATHVMACWRAGRSSLRRPPV